MRLILVSNSTATESDYSQYRSDQEICNPRNIRLYALLFRIPNACAHRLPVNVRQGKLKVKIAE